MIKRQKGCNDIYGREAKIWKYVDDVIDALMEKYNYTYIRTPLFESTELFHRGVGETTDIVSKESYDFADADSIIALTEAGDAVEPDVSAEDDGAEDPNAKDDKKTADTEGCKKGTTEGAALFESAYKYLGL